MDAVAVFSASDNQLESVELTRKGNISALKNFCERVADISVNSNRTLQLKESIRKISKDKSNKEKSKKSRQGMCYVGYMLYHKKSFQNYKTLRWTKTGDVGEQKFDGNATKQGIVELAKSKFVTNGFHEKFGRMSSYVFSLGNSSGKRIPETLMLEGKSVTFTLDNYIKTTCLTRYRFYLLMKKNHDIFLEDFEEVHSSDDDFSLSIIQTRHSWKSLDDINSTIASSLNQTRLVQQSTMIGTISK